MIEFDDLPDSIIEQLSDKAKAGIYTGDEDSIYAAFPSMEVTRKDFKPYSWSCAVCGKIENRKLYEGQARNWVKEKICYGCYSRDGHQTGLHGISLDKFNDRRAMRILNICLLYTSPSPRDRG